MMLLLLRVLLLVGVQRARRRADIHGRKRGSSRNEAQASCGLLLDDSGGSFGKLGNHTFHQPQVPTYSIASTDGRGRRPPTSTIAVLFRSGQDRECKCITVFVPVLLLSSRRSFPWDSWVFISCTLWIFFLCYLWLNSIWRWKFIEFIRRRRREKKNITHAIYCCMEARFLRLQTAVHGFLFGNYNRATIITMSYF